MVGARVVADVVDMSAGSEDEVEAEVVVGAVDVNCRSCVAVKSLGVL